MSKHAVAFLAFGLMGMFLLLSLPTFAEQKYPGEHWEKASFAEALGYSSEELKLAKEQFESMGSAAVMVVVDGVVLAEWGDIARNFRAHSMRKSLFNAIFGIHVHEGRLNLDNTLEELGIDDNQPLTAEEKQATIRHLLKGRSGIYLPALALGGSLSNPPRGSHPPGTYFYYNNWDFNVLGTIFEKESGTKIFEEFKRRIADPLQMEDFAVENCVYDYGSHSDNVNTLYPAYPFRISARDLARFGLMYLQNGKWRGQPIVPEEWIKESFTPYSVYFGEKTRYCYTNWKAYLKGKRLPGGVHLEDNVYWTSGVGVHRVYIVPWANLVLVHRINSDLPLKRPSGQDVDRLLALILKARISDLEYALVRAAATGDEKIVKALLQRGADVHTSDELGQTALHWASRRKNAPLVKLLLDHGADANARDLLGATPMLRAVVSGAEAVIEELSRAGADVESRPEIPDQTPLIVAACRARPKVVKALIEAGADVNAKGKTYHETPLILAALSGNAETVQALLDEGADVNAATSHGQTAIMLAEALGHGDIIRLLEGAGAQREKSRALLPLEAYLPPYLVANAKQGKSLDPRAAQAILGRSKEIKFQGETSLPFSAMRGDVEALRTLLAEGANINVKSTDGWTGLLLASVNGHNAVIQTLLDEGAEVNPKEKVMEQTALIWAIKGGHVDTVNVLLKAGADVNAKDKYGGTALTRAAAGGHAEIVKVLLKAGADIHAKENDSDTALLEAIDGGHLDILQVLLEAGANVNERYVDGLTPLMVAAIRGKEKIAKALLDAGAYIHSKDKFGTTALGKAKALNHEKVIELLEKAGAKDKPNESLSP